MATLLLRFPGRRYHATPWGHHVNEGLVEWPPSPWRLLRAFLATGYTKLHWPAEGPPTVARTLIEKLAASLPRYRLPGAVGTHSRHYMPLARFKNGREETTLVFDTWAQVDDGVLAVRWEVDLSGEEAGVLADLVRALDYLGRAESWIEGDLLSGGIAGDDDGFDVRPDDENLHPGTGWEQFPLLCPLSREEYAAWRAQAVVEAVAAIPVVSPKGKELTKAALKRKAAAVEAAYPADLIGCLQVETGWLHRLGWSQPPGSRKRLYWRRSDALEGAAPRLKPRSVRAAPVECMLLALATASGNQHALPAVTRVVPQADLLHQALNAHAARIAGHSPVLSGCDANGRPLTTPHHHAHLLHLDLDGDGHLDHVLIWAPMGLDADAQAAVRAVRRTFTKGGTAPLRLALAVSGSRTELAALPPPIGGGLLPVLGGSELRARRWRSLTPFVAPRHLKRSGRNTLLGQVTAELATRGLPAPETLDLLDPRTEEARHARHVVRVRRRGPLPPVDLGFVLEISFAEPVAGPLALGYGCHFGLGLFAANCRETLESAAPETAEPEVLQ